MPEPSDSAVSPGRSWYPGLDAFLDIFTVRQYFDVITSTREVLSRAKADADFVDTVRRAALKLPWEHRPAVETTPFPPLRRRRASGSQPSLGMVATAAAPWRP